MNKMLFAVSALAVLLVGSFSGRAAETQRFSNEDYNFSVEFPADMQVCPALSGDHPHGFYGYFGQSGFDCHYSSAVKSKIGEGIYGDFNTGFIKDLKEFAKDVTEESSWCPKSRAVFKNRKDISALTFTHRRSFACDYQRTDGSIDIVVVTMAGKYPVDPGDGPEWKTPSTLYYASLFTTRDRLDADLPVFRRFLSSIKIDSEK